MYGRWSCFSMYICCGTINHAITTDYIFVRKNYASLIFRFISWPRLMFIIMWTHPYVPRQYCLWVTVHLNIRIFFFFIWQTVANDCALIASRISCPSRTRLPQLKSCRFRAVNCRSGLRDGQYGPRAALLFLNLKIYLK